MDFAPSLTALLQTYPQLIDYAPFIGAGAVVIGALVLYFQIQKGRAPQRQKTGVDRVLERMEHGSVPISLDDFVFQGLDDTSAEVKLDSLKTRIDAIAAAKGGDDETASRLKKSLLEDLKETKEKLKDIRVDDHQLSIEMQAAKEKIRVIGAEKEKLKLDLVRESDTLNKLGEGNAGVDPRAIERVNARLDDVSTKLGRLSALEAKEKNRLEHLMKSVNENGIGRNKKLDELLVSFGARLEKAAIGLKTGWGREERDLQKRLKEIDREIKELQQEQNRVGTSPERGGEEKIGGMGKTEKRLEELAKQTAKLHLESENVREKLSGVQASLRRINSLNFKGKNKETRVQELLSLF